MLTIYSRRQFMRVGVLGLGGLTLPGLLAFKAAAAEQRKYVADKSVVFLFLYGGPSQHETFDPKKDAPDNVRSVMGQIQTALPGVAFGSTFPGLAERANRLAVVRSFKTGNTKHDQGESTFIAGNPTQGAMGSLYARLAGPLHPTRGMIANVGLTPQSFGQAHREGKDGAEVYRGAFLTGSLAGQYAAFHPTGLAGPPLENTSKTGGRVVQSQLLSDLTLRLPPERLDERKLLLNQLEKLQRRLDDGGEVERLHRYQQQAYDVLLNGVSKAFDLSQEDRRTLERYDTSNFRTPEDTAKRIPNTAYHSPITLGKQLLTARRLCEAGCGFVTVGMNGWDMHANNVGFGIPDGMAVLGPAVDRAVSAFLDDVEERGLSERILLVIAGEMGRTPRLNVDKTTGRPGRDHWAELAPLVLAGGGLKMGQVIGASDRSGGTPATQPYALPHLLTTIMHTLFDAGELRVTPGMPTDLVRLIAEGQPIRELFS